MGPQSQFRVKASRVMRKRPKHQLKAHQNRNLKTADGKCRQCENLRRFNGGLLYSKPHKAHALDCPRRRDKSDNNPNNQPDDMKKGRIIRSQADIDAFLAPRKGKKKVRFHPNETESVFHFDPNESIIVDPTQLDGTIVDDPLPTTAGEFRRLLDERIEGLKVDSRSTKSKAPMAILEMTNLLLSFLPTKFKNDSNKLPTTDRAIQAFDWFKKVFNGASFTVPSEPIFGGIPSPHYNSIKGQTIVILRSSQTFV